MFRPAVALAALTLSGLAWADDGCSTTVHGTDQMTFDETAITVPAACKQFTVTLEHPGEMPKSVMGHNWVLTQPQDEEGVINDGAAAGIDSDYLKPGDTRILAHTPLIGAGETASVTFQTSQLKAGTAYTYFCSFPAHALVMKGTLSLGS